MVASATMDQAILDALGQRIEGDLAGAATVGLLYLGDRLGLFGALRDGGPATSTSGASAVMPVSQWPGHFLSMIPGRPSST